ncbi:MAG: Inner membrane protein translocase and chaperone YidC, long form [Burkholderiaceae bacterium]|jgi:YidC/Oxa1 family membrane protein insertase|nr:MAG: Inner membrane protein translocase and chaperone YidC, long form [Burkholderiaceae bacterium]
MNDIRRTILWVIFGFSLVLLWDQWQVYNGHKATFFPSAHVAIKAGESASAAGGSAATPAASPSTAQPATAGQLAQVAQVPGAQPGGTAPAPAGPAHQQVVVSTDVLRLTFDTEGGSLVRSALLKVPDEVDKSQPFVLMQDDAQTVYVAQSGLIGATGSAGFPTHKTVMTLLPDARTLTPGSDTLTVRFESPDLGGVKLIKTYTLKRGSYALGVKFDVVNTGTAPVSPELYLQLVRDGKPAGATRFYSTFTGPAVYTDEKKYQKIEFKKIDENKAEIQQESSSGYVAMVQHYFASAWLLASGIQRNLFVRKVGSDLYAVGMIVPLNQIAPGASRAVDARLFTGPEEEQTLEALAPGLDLVKDYGWFTIIAKPLYWLLYNIHRFLGNWGWSIVALVFLLKVAFYWLNAKAYSSMAKMKAVGPRITAMRERLKDKPQEMQQEMMKIYREEKVNPMGGCLPMVVQIPVFIALYWVLLSSVEMRGAPWILWIHDLARPDPYYILPLIMACTSLLQTALNPVPPDPMQAKLMWIMPLAFSVMFFFFPAGLVIYYITNNLLSILQQWIINTRMGVPPQFHLPKFR